MEYLQYSMDFDNYKRTLDEVLNLVINGIPSILKHNKPNKTKKSLLKF